MAEQILFGIALLLAITVVYLLVQRRGERRQRSALDEVLNPSQPHGYIAERKLAEILRSSPFDGVELQYEFESAVGKSVRADAVVRVGDSLVPIDSKFPKEPFLQLASANPDSPLGRKAASAFRSSVKTMIDEINSKYIRPDEETFNFALMFVPADVVCHEAMLDEAIMDHAEQRSVLLVSPGSLKAYLSVIDRGQRGVKLEENTAELLGRIDTVRRDFDAFRQAYDTLGKHLRNANGKHAETRTQLDHLEKRLERALEAQDDF